jgi:hypothetical protein
MSEEIERDYQRQVAYDFLKKDIVLWIFGGVATTCVGLGLGGIIHGINWKNKIEELEDQLEQHPDAFLIGGGIFLGVGVLLVIVALTYSYFTCKNFEIFESDEESEESSSTQIDKCV